VIPSLDPSLNTQTIISSSLFSAAENVFWFGTLIASKDPQGTCERFKIINPNKVTCNVKFTVKPRSMSKSEGFAFKVEPESLSIVPNQHKYVTVHFNPTEMKQYGGVFEAIVERGELNPKQGKLSFEIRGEGTLPSLQVAKPDEFEADGTPALKFRRTRIGKHNYLQIVLKNEGQVPATVRFDAITNEAFSFEGSSMNHTIMSKANHAFDIKFIPRKVGNERFVLTFQTQNNNFE
jgi:hydrocephalus-inducing protein